jgi:hypothetical protein
MGPRFAWIQAAKVTTSGAPLYELYGICGDQGYALVTTGTIASKTALIQEATVTSPAGYARRKFMRSALVAGTTPASWSKWIELPTSSYSPSAREIIVDGTNGDDVEGNGTEARPVKTIQKAIGITPGITRGWRTCIRIKAGAYVIGNAELEISMLMGGRICVTSYSGERDVEIVLSDIPAYTDALRGVLFSNVHGVEVYNLRFVKHPGTRRDTGIMAKFTFLTVVNCEFENFDIAIRKLYGGEAHIVGCNYINCNNAIYVQTGGIALHGTSTATGTSYINTVNGGIIIKQGTHQAGTVATDRILKGLII